MYKYRPNGHAVEVRSCNLVFFGVPKVASSSIKKMLFEMCTGAPFRALNPDGSKYRVHHDFSPTRRFQEIAPGKYDGWTKITLVRDPVVRILSAYANRVIDLNILGEKKITRQNLDKLGLSYDPPLYYFLENIDKYRILSRPIWHHTAPFTSFLGHDLDYFDHVFKFEELDKLVHFLNNYNETPVKIPEATNQSKTRFAFSGLGSQAQKSLLDYCAGDYALLKGYYSPPALNI